MMQASQRLLTFIHHSSTLTAASVQKRTKENDNITCVTLPSMDENAFAWCGGANEIVWQQAASHHTPLQLGPRIRPSTCDFQIAQSVNIGPRYP